MFVQDTDTDLSVPARPAPVPPLLAVKEMVLVCWLLLASVHVHRAPVRPAAGPAHAPRLPLVAGDEV